MRSLYLGEGPCFRANIIQKLGYDVVLFTQQKAFSSLFHFLVRQVDIYISKALGAHYSPISRAIIRGAIVKLLAKQNAFNIIFVNQAAWLTPSALRLILRHSPNAQVIVFCNDDITGIRDKSRFRALLSCILYVNLWLVCRETNVLELLSLGAVNVQRIWMGYFEDIHAPVLDRPDQTRSNLPAPDGKVLFIGTNILGENRVTFLTTLIRAGIPLVVLGQRWPSLSTPEKKESVFFNYLVNGLLYSYYLSSSIAILGLLSHGNRDLHTTRTFECIAASGCFVAERTSEHQLLYEDRFEALFWSNDNECINILKSLYTSEMMPSSIKKSIISNASNLNLASFELTAALLAAFSSLSKSSNLN